MMRYMRTIIRLNFHNLQFKKNKKREESYVASSNSTFSPSILKPMYITTMPTGIQMYHATPNPAGMYPNTIAMIATNIE